MLDLETLILAAFSTITSEGYQKWIKNAGIYVYNDCMAMYLHMHITLVYLNCLL